MLGLLFVFFLIFLCLILYFYIGLRINCIFYILEDKINIIWTL